MDEKKFEDLMDRWAAREIEGAPDTSPAPGVYRRLEAKTRRRGRRLVFRPLGWGAVGLAGAAVILFIVLRPSPELVPSVGLRADFAGEAKAGKSSLAEDKAMAREQAMPIAPTAAGRGRTDKDEIGGVEKKSTPKKEAGPGRLSVEFQLGGSPDVHEWDVERPGEEARALSEADNYRLVLDLAAGRTVYVFQVGPGKGLAVLFPNPDYSPEGNPLRAGRIRIPAPPDWFFPRGDEGEVTISVVSAETSDPEIDDLLIRYLGATKRRESKRFRDALISVLGRLRESPEGGVDVRAFSFRIRR